MIDGLMMQIFFLEFLLKTKTFVYLPFSMYVYMLHPGTEIERERERKGERESPFVFWCVLKSSKYLVGPCDLSNRHFVYYTG